MSHDSISRAGSATPRRRVLTAAGVIAALAGVAAGTANAASSAELTCGATVTSDVRLTADLVDCPGPALVIGASGITIDLGGHVIDGVGGGAGVDGNGRHARVTIRNGTIREFGRGIELLENHGSRLVDLTLTGNAVGVAAGRTNRLVIEDVTATGSSFAGFELTFGNDARVLNSTVTGSGHGGIIDRFSTGSRYKGNVLSENTFFGITLDSATGATVAGNEVRANMFSGIELGFRAESNRIIDNVVSSNGGDGITIEEPGNVVARNTASGNGGYGILAVAGTIDRGGNVAEGNGAGDCLGVTCG